MTGARPIANGYLKVSLTVDAAGRILHPVGDEHVPLPALVDVTVAAAVFHAPDDLDSVSVRAVLMSEVDIDDTLWSGEPARLESRA
jgi:hypothetical protein